MTLDQLMNGTLIQRAEFQHPDSMIFDPFEINEDEDQIVAYNGELNPDRNYVNKFSHQLNKSSNYHNEDSFKKYIKINCYEGGDVSFIHSNIQSIPAYSTAFVSYLSNINCDFSVIGLSETWLNSSTIDTYGIDGYSHAGLFRESGKGGGVSLFVCDKMIYHEMSELTMMIDYIECVFIKINYLDYKLIVGVVYRPPNSNMVDFNDSMHDILDKIALHPCYIMGDFNLDLLKHELHRPTERFLDTMYANSYIHMINRPTRVARNTCTLIDNIFTNNYNINSQHLNGILQADFSDHYILFHIIKSTDSTKDASSDHKTVRIVHESRINGFVEKIQNTDWSVMNSHRDCQTYFAKCYALFKTIYDRSFPPTRVQMRYRNRLPWLTDGLQNSIKNKN